MSNVTNPPKQVVRAYLEQRTRDKRPPPTPGEFTSGLWMVFIGTWLFAVFDHRFDLTFRNSWPLLLIGGGLIMVIKPFLEKRALQKKGISHE